MKTLSITATKRETNGKVNTKGLRKQGLVPCTLYGGKEQVFFSFEEKNFKNIIFTPDLHEVAFNIDGSEHRACSNACRKCELERITMTATEVFMDATGQ